jgi:hypothetical protein
VSVARIRALVERAGETVTLRRITGTTSQTNTDVSLKASIRGYAPDQIDGTSIKQGDSEVIISTREIVAAGWPAPPQQNDRILRDGKPLIVHICETRNFREEVGLYILQCRG